MPVSKEFKTYEAGVEVIIRGQLAKIVKWPSAEEVKAGSRLVKWTVDQGHTTAEYLDDISKVVVDRVLHIPPLYEEAEQEEEKILEGHNAAAVKEQK